MAVLTSSVLKEIKRLQRCANEPMQHIALKKPPESGPHVQAIHHALAMLGYDDIYYPEINGHDYGPSTASAIVEFKKKYDIRSLGQREIDNVVGQLTIQRLDSLLPGGSQNSGDSAKWSTTFEVSPRKVLKARVFWLSSAKDQLFSPIGAYVTKATELLSRHGMHASASATSPTTFVDFDQDLDDFGGPANDSVLQKARNVVNASVNVGGVVTIVGRFKAPFSNTQGRINGHTALTGQHGFTHPNTIFINSEVMAKDRVTLLHEMGHCAGADMGGVSPDAWKSDEHATNFMSHQGKETRTEIWRWQGDALASSSFAFEDKGA